MTSVNTIIINNLLLLLLLVPQVQHKAKQNCLKSTDHPSQPTFFLTLMISPYSPTGNTVHNAYNVEQLKVEAYNVALENRFGVLQAAGNAEDSWLLFRDAVNETADSVLGKTRGKRKERWISSSTWKIIDERMNLKAKTNPDRRQRCCSNYNAV